MGLDCSHGAWSGAYSAFMRWRRKLAQVAGLPPLDLMEGFYVPLGGDGMPATLYHGFNTEPWMADLDRLLPIRWACLKPSPLHELLYHSDCDGEIAAEHCGAIADALEELIPFLPDEDDGGHIGNWREKTRTFVNGLRDAAAAGEALSFY